MNFNFAIDTSGFKPFDISIPLALIADYNQGYDKNQEIYDKISQTLGQLESSVINSPKAKQLYDAYYKDFQNASDSFASGMNINNVKALKLLRRRFGTDITKLENARQAMSKIADARKLAMAEGRGADMLYQDIGILDNYLDNPNYSPSSYNGAQLTKEVSDAASALAKGLINAGKYGNLDNYTKLWIQKTGMSPEQVTKTIQELRTGGIEAVTSPIFKNLVSSIIDSSGVMKWGDTETKKRALGYAAQGLYHAIGEAKVSTYEDYANKKALDNYYDMLKIQEQARQARITAAQQQQDAASLNIKPDNYYDSLEVDNAQGKLQEYISKGYFTLTKNAQGKPQYVMTEEGKRAYLSTPKAVGNPDRPSSQAAQVHNTVIDRDFQDFVNKYSSAQTKGVGYLRTGRLFNELYRNTGSSGQTTNAYQVPGYRVDYSANDGKSIMRHMGQMYKAKWDNNKKAWVSSGEEVKFETDDSGNYTGNIDHKVMTSNGTVYYYKDKEGKITRIVPASGSHVHKVAEQNRDLLLGNAETVANLGKAYRNRVANPQAYRKAIDNINVMIQIHNSIPANAYNQLPLVKTQDITDQTIRSLESLTKQFVTDAYIMDAQIFGEMHTKPQDIEQRDASM